MFSHSSVLIPVLVASAASLAFGWPSSSRAAEHRVSGPYTHENLTIFLIHGASAQGPVPLTLDEALAKGTVKVHETGTVGELEIENMGEEEVLVHAGDIVKGGQQDRVVTASLIMKGKSGRIPLSVFCVESGRWAARGAEDVRAFSSVSELLPTREAKLAMKAPYATAAGTEPATPNIARMSPNAGGAARAPENELETAGEEARQETRPAAGAAASPQSEVWRNVSKIQAALAANLGASVASEDSETSLQLALENEKLAQARKAYIEALEGAGEREADVVGLAFAINGRINSADIYSSNALFRKLWQRLLKAAVTEAIGADKSAPTAPEPTAAGVDAFLADAAQGKMSEREAADGQKLETREADTALDFATRRASGEVVHRNVLARH
jgi:hypothetical protein